MSNLNENPIVCEVNGQLYGKLNYISPHLSFHCVLSSLAKVLFFFLCRLQPANICNFFLFAIPTFQLVLLIPETVVR